jgi:hypothetical protein
MFCLMLGLKFKCFCLVFSFIGCEEDVIVLEKCRNLTFGRVWGWHSQSWKGIWEPFENREISELDCRGQNTSHWGAIYIIGKLWKCRCRKWARMGHLDICSTSYVRKKGRESNWQFDSRPLKVGNRPDPGVQGPKSSEKKLQVFFKPCPNRRSEHRVMTSWNPRTLSGLHLGSPEIKSHSDVGAAE